MPIAKPPRLLAAIAPGILVAATGVGAGDLAASALSGAHLGVAVAWVIVLGALVKLILNEGLARWQIATEHTILEGFLKRFGALGVAVFGIYLVLWCIMVGGILASACGKVATALLPLDFGPFPSATNYAILCSAASFALVLKGGFKVFARVMAVSIGLLFVVVLYAAAVLLKDPGDLIKGLTVPTIPKLNDGGLTRSIALMGGVGGTLTVICYAYWMREAGRTGAKGLRACRVDLAVGYATTALFGVAVLVIASRVDPADLQGKGAGLVVALANALESTPLGAVGRYAFLIGAFAAVFSSMLGVWQSVPSVCVQWFDAVVGSTGKPYTGPERPAYTVALLLLATLPIALTAVSFAWVVTVYGVLGAAFIPGLALTLLILNNSRTLVSEHYRNGALTNAVLVVALALSVVAAIQPFL